MENPEIAQIFEEIADLLEIQGANPFRVRAYRVAARTIRDLSESVTEIARSTERHLYDLPGIGKDLAEKIQTILATGDLPLRRELESQVPPALRELLNVPGLGPKRASLLYEKLGIHSLAELKMRCRGASHSGSQELRRQERRQDPPWTGAFATKRAPRLFRGSEDLCGFTRSAFKGSRRSKANRRCRKFPPPPRDGGGPRYPRDVRASSSCYGPAGCVRRRH